MRNFNAPWDNVNKIITTIILLFGGAWLAYYLIIPGADKEQLIGIGILLIAVVITWLSSPTKYTTDEKQVTAHRPGGNLTIPYSAIEKIERIHKGTLGFGLRLFGSGGLFGYLGIFTYPTTGRVNMVCTDRSKMVMVTTKKGRTILSPELPEDFINAIQPYINKEGR